MSKDPIRLDVYSAADLCVIEGVMQGEPMSFADELVMDDVYALGMGAQTRPLAMTPLAEGGFTRCDTGSLVHIDSLLHLMGPDGTLLETVVLVCVHDNTVEDIYLLPLGDLMPKQPYRLVEIARQTATRRFADAASGSFARGTRITLADGRMQEIETLKVGDAVLTRDAGRQPVRWIGQTTLRATGVFAPVVITAGALHNDRDLVLRADHRLFIYQREDRLGAGRAEVLIKARQLLNHKTVLRRRGGFVDYFQLILGDHHIIYAEGIAAESHLIDPRTRYALPRSVRDLYDHRTSHMDYDVKQTLVPTEEAAALLRGASAS